MLILGISAYYRDSAAALVRDGEIFAAAQEERFTRKKHDAGFPAHAIQYCLQEARATLADVDCIVFYDKLLVEFNSPVETDCITVPVTFGSSLKALPISLKERFYVKARLKKELAALRSDGEKRSPQLRFIDSRQPRAAALAIWYELLGNHRGAATENNSLGDALCGRYLGPWFAPNSIAEYLDSIKAPYRKFNDDALIDALSGMLANEKIIGWFQGRMEFGARALGGRSIFAAPRSAKMQPLLNANIDARQLPSPFALVIKVERESEWRACGSNNPHGLRVVPVAADSDPRLYQLLDHFEKETGCAALVNTPLSVRGEPMVCTPEEAYCCFMRTAMDCLVLEDMLLQKCEQPVWDERQDWQNEFESN